MLQSNHILFLDELNEWSVGRTSIRPGISDDWDSERKCSILIIVAPHYFVDAYICKHFKMSLSKRGYDQLIAEAILAWRDGQKVTL